MEVELQLVFIITLFLFLSNNNYWLWQKKQPNSLTRTTTSCLPCPAETHVSSSLTSVENDETSCYCAASQVSNSNKVREIYDNWETLGLPGQPNTGDNGVHASASPFEAMAERNNWLSMSKEEDPYALGMMAAGISTKTIEECDFFDVV